MSATYSQLPGTLNLEFCRGDELSTSVDFSVSLSGYTVAAEVVSLVSGAHVLSPTTAVTDAANGLVNISLSETQTSAIPAGTYRWSLWWDAPGAVRRTMLSGFVEVLR